MTVVLAAASAAAAVVAWGWRVDVSPMGPHVSPVSAASLLAAIVMWQAMMVAMMTPAVAPWVLAFGRLAGDTPAAGPVGPAWSFAGGYFTIWLGYSVLAATLQSAFAAAGFLGHDGPPPVVAGALLIAAGVFQFLPLKQACLTHCRNPLSYLLARWRGGPPRAFLLGVRHGAYCVGCCWLLMLTGFAMGVMNLAWMALLTIVIAVEQIAPGGGWLGRVFGAGLLVWGGVLCWPA